MSDLAVQTDLAVEAEKLRKTYPLYPSVRHMALDRLGVYAVLPWMRPAIKEFVALDGIDLRIRRGERVAIIGRNGAGKTTLLKLLTRNFAAASGYLSVKGTVQAVMQTGLGFHPEFTGLENIRAGLHYNGLMGAELDRAVTDVVEFSELGEFLSQPISTYSAGMQARVQFATATAIKPDILIIDEVLGAGDAYFSGKSAHRMRKLASSGCTLVFVSHAMDQVLQFCDRAVWLERGRVRADGKALDVVRTYEEFIARMTADRATGTEASQVSDYVTPQWQQEDTEKLLMGGQCTGGAVSRWPGIDGLSIKRVALADADGQEKAAFKFGEEIRVRIFVQAQTAGVLPMRLVVLFMTLAGIPITRLLSPYLELHSEAGGERVFEARIAAAPFTAQELIFSVGAFKEYEPEAPQHSTRYEVLSRSFRFRILGGVPNDPGSVAVAAAWSDMPA
jgi:lipopolysaccharide transport system ATP-binding protein